MKKSLPLLLLIPILFFTCGFSKTPNDETRELPILMYHKVLNGSKGKYVVSEKQLESDILRLKRDGYETVFMSQVIDWVDGRGTLPPKPIVLTFDDGHYNNMHYALPLAQKHNIKFMIYPVTAFSAHTERTNDANKPEYSHLTFAQIGECARTGHIEFGSHTHNMHKFRPRFGIAKMGDENPETYRRTLLDDVRTSMDLIEGSGAPRPQTFAYPFGKFSRNSREMLLELGFRAFLECTEGTSTITKNNPQSLHRLKRYNRDGSASTDTVFNKLIQSKPPTTNAKQAEPNSQTCPFVSTPRPRM
ncbi:MAG: polysaccharide deacetylase family protein [Firmicutes bacterium]|nr:polysaccharide deacetylase family protein [Bacillota bacterium]